VGLLLGGVLTQTVSWRWCLYINLAFAIPGALAAMRLLVNEAQRNRPRLDLPGTLTGSAGLFALVYGFSSSETGSWGDPVTIAALVIAGALLGAFVAIESRVAHPLLPLRVLRERTRAGSYLAIFLSGIAIFAVFLFLTYYLQRTKGLDPIDTGLAFLPMTGVIIATATSVNIKFLHRIGPRPLLVLGMLCGAGAMAWLAQLTPTSSYAGHVLPALLLMGFGMGNIFAPAIASATYGVARHDSGVASAMVNVGQQVGGSIGTAALSSIFATAVADYASGRPHTAAVIGAASVHGYTVAFWVAAGIFGVGALLVGTMMRSVRVSGEEAPAADPMTLAPDAPTADRVTGAPDAEGEPVPA
jgi:MFS family permease